MMRIRAGDGDGDEGLIFLLEESGDRGEKGIFLGRVAFNIH